MAVFGLGIVVAPIIGPTLGGWITGNYSWRWIFYINVPIGVIAVLMANTFIEGPPYTKNQRPGQIDYVLVPGAALHPMSLLGANESCSDIASSN
jgi:DHA2 family multidrug resistance protein